MDNTNPEVPIQWKAASNIYPSNVGDLELVTHTLALLAVLPHWVVVWINLRTGENINMCSKPLRNKEFVMLIFLFRTQCWTFLNIGKRVPKNTC